MPKLTFWHVIYKYHNPSRALNWSNTMDENVAKLKASLSDQIWFTRKARIRTSERLLSNKFHLNLILIWYSFITFSISIYLIKKPDLFSEHTDVIMTLATGAVFTLSLFVPQLNLQSRYEALKENYISMQTLNSELSLCTMKDEVLEIQRRYSALLSSVENHKSLDMLYFINFDAGSNCTRKLYFLEKLFLFFHVIFRKLLLVFIYSIPFSIIWFI